MSWRLLLWYFLELVMRLSDEAVRMREVMRSNAVGWGRIAGRVKLAESVDVVASQSVHGGAERRGNAVW